MKKLILLILLAITPLFAQETPSKLTDETNEIIRRYFKTSMFDGNPTFFFEHVQSLPKEQLDEVIQILNETLEGKRDLAQMNAVDALVVFHNESSILPLKKHMLQKEIRTSFRSALALGKIGTRAAVEALLEAFYFDRNSSHGHLMEIDTVIRTALEALADLTPLLTTEDVKQDFEPILYDDKIISGEYLIYVFSILEKMQNEELFVWLADLTSSHEIGMQSFIPALRTLSANTMKKYFYPKFAAIKEPSANQEILLAIFDMMNAPSDAQKFSQALQKSGNYQPQVIELAGSVIQNESLTVLETMINGPEFVDLKDQRSFRKDLKRYALKALSKTGTDQAISILADWSEKNSSDERIIMEVDTDELAKKAFKTNLDDYSDEYRNTLIRIYRSKIYHPSVFVRHLTIKFLINLEHPLAWKLLSEPKVMELIQEIEDAFNGKGNR